MRQGPRARLLANKGAVVALTYLVAVCLAALAAPALSPRDPYAIELGNSFSPPSRGHFLGTDELGRDLLSRLLFASRTSLLAAALAASIATAIGVTLGIVSAYKGGWWDAAISRSNDAMMSFPALVLAISLVGFLGPGLTNAMIAIGLVYAPRVMRVVRSASVSVREESYVRAAIMMGRSDAYVIVRHVLPNILPPLVVETTLALGLAMLAEAALSFIGVGVQPPVASWGSMLKEAFPYISESAVIVVAPGMAIMLTVFAFNALGDGLGDMLGRGEARA